MAHPGEQQEHQVSMSEFVRYLGTPGRQRYAVAAGMGQPYSPVRDPYARMRNAIKAGRRLGNDCTAINSAIANCWPSMKVHYREVGQNWLRYRYGRGSSEMVELHTGRWHTGTVAVRVAPDLALQYPDGTIEAIKLHFKAEVLAPEAATAMLWLLSQAMPQCCPGAIPVVLDVRRRQSHAAGPIRPGYQTWLEAEAASLAHFRTRAAA